MGNPERSWEGAPTTNLVPNPYANWNGSSFVFGGYNYDATGTQTYTYVTSVPNPIGSPAVMQYTTGTTGYKYWAVQGTVATTGTHTFSYYARIISGPTATSNLSNSQLWRSNGVDQAVTGDWNPTYTTEWVRYSTTGPCTAGTVLDYFPIHSGGLTGGYTIQYCGFQLELGTYATPFVNGTRSNTQALLDLTSKTTITMTSPIYNNNGTFSFNGGTDRIDLAASIGPMVNNFTISAWMNSTNIAATQNILSMNGPYFMRIDGSKVRFNVLTDSWLFQNGTTTLSSNIWYFLTMVWNGTAGTWTGYINDTQEFSVSKSGSINAAYSNFYGYVGYTPQGGEQSNFFGQIPVVYYYNRALSALEVSQNFNALRGRYGI
jgi:hypothetical protein